MYLVIQSTLEMIWLCTEKGEVRHMAGYLVNIAGACLIGLIFILLGIRQCKSESPVTMNTGEKPLKAEQLSDVKAWNKGHGKALIAFGIVIAFTLGTFPAGLNYMNAVTATILWIMAVTAELIGLTVNHKRLERIYRKYL